MAAEQPKIELSLLLNRLVSGLKSLKKLGTATGRKEVLVHYDTFCRAWEERKDDSALDIKHFVIDPKHSLETNISRLISRNDSIVFLFNVALQEGSYSHARSIYLCHMRQNPDHLLGASFPWTKFIDLAKQRQDWDGVQAIVHDMLLLGYRPLTTSLANELLGAALSSAIQGGRDADKMILAVLNLMDLDGLAPDHDTFTMLLGHYASHSQERLLQLLPIAFRSKSTQPSGALCRYIIYNLLQERQQPRLALDVYEYILHKDRDARHLHSDIALHEAFMDGILDRQDLEKALQAFNYYRRAVSDHLSQKPLHIDAANTWTDLTRRLVHLACAHQAHDKVHDILCDLQNMSRISKSLAAKTDSPMPAAIPAHLWHHIFTWILASPSHQEDPLGYLQAWLAKLFSLKGHGKSNPTIFYLDSEMRQAILQLSSRFLLPESFLQFIEDSISHQDCAI